MLTALYYKELGFFHEKDVFPWGVDAAPHTADLLLEQDQHLSPYSGTANITRPDGLLQEICEMFQYSQLHFFVFHNQIYHYILSGRKYSWINQLSGLVSYSGPFPFTESL